MDHLIGLALGSTSCDVAVRRGPESTGFGGTIPTTLAFRPDGSVLVGEAAEKQAECHPVDVLRDFVRRVGDRTPIVVAGRTLTAADAVALFVDGVVAEPAASACRRSASRSPTQPAGPAARSHAFWPPSTGGDCAA